MVTFFAHRILDADVALDLTAETFAQAFAARPSFRGDTDDEARAWPAGLRAVAFADGAHVDRARRDIQGAPADGRSGHHGEP
jgi:RNA polymerase sigma-70 factor (ECF subfamily)